MLCKTERRVSGRKDVGSPVSHIDSVISDPFSYVGRSLRSGKTKKKIAGFFLVKKRQFRGNSISCLECQIVMDLAEPLLKSARGIST